MKLETLVAVGLLSGVFVFGQIARTDAQEKPGTPPVVAPSAQAETAYPVVAEAAKLLTANPAFLKAAGKEATLTDKVRALEERNVLRALEMVKAWRMNPAAPVMQNAPDNFEDFKPVCRVFALEAYVLLSEGRTLNAIGITEQGMGVAALPLRRNRAGLSVGSECEKIVLAPLGRNLATVSLKEVDALTSLAKNWLLDEPAVITMLAGEREVALTNLGQSPELAKIDADTRAAAEKKSRAQINLFFSRLQENTRTPYPQWAAERFGADKPNTNATPLEKSVVEPQAQQMDSLIAMVKRKTLGRLLAIHAAILKYRWENGKLPATLDDLKLGSLTTDPFTDAPFLYKIAGREYTLESAGEIVFDESSKPDEAHRKHFGLVPSRKVETKPETKPKFSVR